MEEAKTARQQAQKVLSQAKRELHKAEVRSERVGAAPQQNAQDDGKALDFYVLFPPLRRIFSLSVRDNSGAPNPFAPFPPSPRVTLVSVPSDGKSPGPFRSIPTTPSHHLIRDTMLRRHLGKKGHKDRVCLHDPKQKDEHKSIVIPWYVTRLELEYRQPNHPSFLNLERRARV